MIKKATSAPPRRVKTALDFLESSDDDLEIAMERRTDKTEQNNLAIDDMEAFDDEIEINIKKKADNNDVKDVEQRRQELDNVEHSDDEIEITMFRSSENDDNPTTNESNMVTSTDISNAKYEGSTHHTPSTSFNSEMDVVCKLLVGDDGVVEELDILDDSFSFSDNDGDIETIDFPTKQTETKELCDSEPASLQNSQKTLGIQKQRRVLSTDHLPKSEC